MNPTMFDQPFTWTEITVPHGCVMCDGPVVIRFSQKGAVSLCVRCRSMARPKLEVADGRLTLQQRFEADA